MMLMVLLTAGAASFAQVTISGKVKDNKGKPVRQYEPFISSTHHFQFAATVGVAPTMVSRSSMLAGPSQLVPKLLYPGVMGLI